MLAEFRKRRSGVLFTPPSLDGTIIFPGVDGGAEWGGAAFDPETRAALRQLERDAVDHPARPEQRHGAVRQQVRDRAIATNGAGSPAAPSLEGVGDAASRDEIAAIIRDGTGRMPGFPDMGGRNINDLVDFLVTGKDKAAGSAVTSDPSWLEVSQRRLHPVARPGRLSADHPAVGHAQRDRSQRRHDSLDDSVRRVSGARRQGPGQHGQRQLRWPDRHGRRPALHRRDELRQEVSRLRQAAPASCCGKPRCPRPVARRRRPTSINGRQYVVIVCGGGKNGAPSGSSVVAFALTNFRK